MLSFSARYLAVLCCALLAACSLSADYSGIRPEQNGTDAGVDGDPDASVPLGDPIPPRAPLVHLPTMLSSESQWVDMSGNGWDADLLVSTTAVELSPELGKARHFEGDGYARVAVTSSPDQVRAWLGGGSVFSAVVRPDLSECSKLDAPGCALGRWMTALAVGGGDRGLRLGLVLSANPDDDGTGIWRYGIEANGCRALVNESVMAGGASADVTHLVWARVGDTDRLFVDGVEVLTIDVCGRFDASGTHLSVGSALHADLSVDGESGFVGEVDEVRA